MLEVLRRIVQEFSAAADVTSALEQLVSNVQETLEADRCSIYLADDENGQYTRLVSTVTEKSKLDPPKLKFGEGFVGLVAEREELINLHDCTQHELFDPVRMAGLTGMHAFVGTPVMHRGQLLGVLIAWRHREEAFTEEQEAFLLTLSTQIASELAHLKTKGMLQSLGKRRRQREVAVLSGVTGSPGIAIGRALVTYPLADLDAVPDSQTEDPAAELAAIKSAFSMVRKEIKVMKERSKKTLTPAEQSLFDVYLRILDSRSLHNEIKAEVNEGHWAQGALRRVMKRHILQFESLEDPYLRERATDLRDLGRRLLAQLQQKERQAPAYPKRTILVGEEVTATALLEVPEDRLVGVVSNSGSVASHVAILARVLGVPAVMGVGSAFINEIDNKEIIVDGYDGEVYISPAMAVKKEFKQLIAEEQLLDKELQELRDLPAETTDGHILAMYVNTGLAVDVSPSLSAGAQGVGLYRTEIPFMIRDRFPSEEEQRIIYHQLLKAFSPRPVVMRTLDIGGDKDLSYFPVKEANPFLGWRGIRITLDHPEIFMEQVAAMLRASEGLDNLKIMLPMISSLKEVDSSLHLIHQARAQLLEEGLKIAKPAIGLMIEVPAAVYQARDLASRVDFLSVGSNDLIQYLLAVDRNNARVSDLYDNYHPAVWRALSQVVTEAHKARKPVSICGELAGDPLATALLLGLGFDSLSMNARSLPRIKSVVRAFTYKRAKELLRDVLAMDDSVEIRCHLEMALEEFGLAGLIRAGRH